MSDIILEGARFENLRTGNIQCDKCGRNICKINKDVKSFKLVFVCRCGAMGKARYNSPKRKFELGDTAVRKENRLICPVCGEIIAGLNSDTYVNIGFRIRCGCGAVYDKFKDYSKINMRLKEYK